MHATPQATEQQQSTLHTQPYCTVPNAPPGFSGSSGLIGRRQFKYATSWKLQARCGQGEHASHGMLGRKTRSRGQAVQTPVHPDCGAAHPFDFKTQTTRVKYWLAAKCSTPSVPNYLSRVWLYLDVFQFQIHPFLRCIQIVYYLKKGRRAFGRDRTHKTRYTLPRPLVVLVGVQRNLESPFVASSTYIVPYKKPLMVNSIASLPSLSSSLSSN